MKTYHELLDLCFEAKKKGIHAFFNYSPHVNLVSIQVHKDGYESNLPDKTFMIWFNDINAVYERQEAKNYIRGLIAEKTSTCMGCYHFEPKGGNLGYCEIQDHVVSINFGCDERKEDEESKDGN